MSTAAQTVKRWNMWVVRTHGTQVLCEMESAETPPNGDYISAEDHTALERRVQELEKAATEAHYQMRCAVAPSNEFTDALDALDAILFPAPPDAGGTRGLQRY